ncbi:ABC transporter substrate-binding protein [Humitalea sp. 24SJ18S-53]|uniref:ABC transporter substrate-binding protein n=1 Tax=Humitalea sp. 24SJ18S-53 TaxID=3422307 RepID=UPI003D66ED28
MPEHTQSALSRRGLGGLVAALPVLAQAMPAAAQVSGLPAANIPPPETRSLEELHQAAVAEGGELLVYAGGDLRNGSAATEQAFNRRFPGMKIRILVDRSKFHGVRINNQIARGRVACDVAHVLTINLFEHWKAEGRLLPYKPLGWEEVFADVRDPDAAYVPIGLFSFSTVYNTTLLTEAEAPRDAIDYLDPKLKGKIVLCYPQDDDAILYQFDRIVAAHGWGYMERLMTQDVTWVRGSAPARVMVQRGEKAATFSATGPLVAPAGASFRFIIPRRDSFLTWAQPAAIFGEARHPAAAKLYLSWLLSAEVQGAAGRQWPVRRDVAPATGFGPITTYNTQPARFGAYVQDRARLERMRDQLEQYTGPMQGPNQTGVEGIYPDPG